MPALSADVWFCFTEALTDVHLAAARAVLSRDERNRCDRLASDRDRRSFPAAHALLRSALTFRHGLRSPDSWEFETGSHGKPSLARGQSDLAFNLTHSDRLVACALGDVESLGIDVESVERRVDAEHIARRYFSQNEIFALAQFSGPERHTRFIEMWTLKEAFLKATGAGLAAPLNTFGFELHGTSGLQFSPPDDTTAAEWHFALFAPSPAHRLAVAARSGPCVDFKVRPWSFTAEDAVVESPEVTAAPLVPLRVSP